MSRRALIVVDYLNDFAHPEGALTAGAPAQAIDETVRRAVEAFHGRGDVVVFASDAHTPDDPEFALWPPHAVKGTWGQEIYGTTGELARSLRGRKGVYFVDKTKYDAFFRTDLEDILRAEGVNSVYLAGINTSICVMATAQGAYFRGFRVYVLRDAVADMSREAHDFALRHMEAIFRAELVDTESA
ncbi:cysteine hydrolase family protein [Brockia lithotrophica]|uniref:Nicotinamidase-related amidase n=1 Tax=Brockia lithotrophica TaxID=933949 RepID=A0A660L3F5_9BACL|nr:isochorismatase family cysteine hydrolase [Brockia lithotrophica]RKQ88551.1 nicotinamidase-related amidase [Brockia lithotrophica]